MKQITNIVEGMGGFSLNFSLNFLLEGERKRKMHDIGFADSTSAAQNCAISISLRRHTGQKTNESVVRK